MSDSPAGAQVEYVGLTRSYGATRALDDFSLTVAPGEFLALLGPSGCGKTTALRMLGGYDQPDRGQILVDGVDVSRRPVNKRDMGMVFQSYSLFPTMSARDNVAFGLRIRGQRTDVRRGRADELLDLVGLSGHEAKFPHQLSGGQQQRVALARALAVQPRVLLLDEPLSALDAKVRASLREEIRRLQLELRLTTIFVTHDQDEALSMADRVAVMRAGRVEQVSSPAELYQRPATPFVAEFVGTMNRLGGVVSGDHIALLGQQVPIDGEVPAQSTQVEALLRPESVVVRAAGDGRNPRVLTHSNGAPSSAEATATIVMSTFYGATTRLRLTCTDATELVADVPSHRAAELPVGSTVFVSVLDRPVLVRRVAA